MLIKKSQGTGVYEECGKELWNYPHLQETYHFIMNISCLPTQENDDYDNNNDAMMLVRLLTNMLCFGKLLSKAKAQLSW